MDRSPAKPSDKDRWADGVLERAVRMQRDGADLLDLQAVGGVAGQGDGAAWSAPDADSELRRFVPVLRKFRRNIDVPVCVTTHHAATAERTLELGVDVIHDWSGLCFDPALAKTVNRCGAGLILGHVRGAPENWPTLPPLSDPAAGVAKDLENALARARAAGVEARRIVLDPGLEHGKKEDENMVTLARLGLLARLQRPISVSLSQKRFLTESTRASDVERQFAEAAAATAALLAGAHILRVDHPKEQGHAAKFIDRLFKALERG